MARLTKSTKRLVSPSNRLYLACMTQFSYKKKNNSLCTFDYSSLTLNYVPMSSNHYFLSCNYVCWPFNYCFNFVIQWLGNEVFLIRRSIIACWHSNSIEIGNKNESLFFGSLCLPQYIVSFVLHLHSRGLGIEHCDWFIVPLLLPTARKQFSLDRKRRIHKRNRYSASDSDSFHLIVSLSPQSDYKSDYDSVTSENQP